jgi:cell division protein FtsI (penicillin-binding protein 3)
VTAGRSPRRGSDLDRSRRAADRAVAQAARPRGASGNARPGRSPAPAGRTARAEGPVRVVSSNPHRSARGRPAPTRRPARPRPPEPRGNLPGRTVAAVVHFFAHTPGRRVPGLPDQVVRARSARRMIATGVALVMIFTVVVAKLVDLQVLSPAAYAEVAESQRTHTEALAADRGAIVDRTGVPLALSVPSSSIYFDAQQLADAEGDPAVEAARLAAVLEADPAAVPARTAELEAKMRKPGRFVYLARQLDPAVVAKVKAVKKLIDATDPRQRRYQLTGVAFLDEPRRTRPADDVARSIVGDVDIDGRGLGGLEQQYETQLEGQPGLLKIERSPLGQTIAPSQPVTVPAVRGRDLQLTIDRSLQFDAERILGEQLRESGAESGVALVTRPETGEILAMANLVTKRNGDEVTDVEVSGRNSALIDTYEPGSVMKLVTAAGALEEGRVQPDTTLPVTPTIDVCGRVFGEAEPGHALSGPASVTQIIKQSSNVGTIRLGQLLGRDNLYRYLRQFGFGDRSAVDFPNEAAGRVPRPDHQDEWWCSSDGAVPIGQSVAVTPLQMLMAYNAVANRGVYVPPKLVGATVDGDGVRHPTPTEPGRRVVSPETADDMNRILRSVVEEGTGTAAAIPGYTPAGKTGTARRAQGGTYQGTDGKVHYDATFVGFVPAEAPALSVLVLVRDPTKSIYGGTVAAPAFSRIAAAALRHFNIPPPANDLAAGGAVVGGRSDGPDGTPAPKDPAAAPSPLASGVERGADGRVRVRPAGETTTTAPPTTTPATAPARTTASRTTASPTTLTRTRSPTSTRR